MGTRGWGLLAAVLVVAGCSSAPPPATSVVEPVQVARSGYARGIDLPIDARDVSNELRESGLDFVARYYRHPTSRWPTLSAQEAALLSSAGMTLVAIWESYSHNPAYFSYSRGYADALSAYRQAKAIGQPAGSAIYFAVDFNARQSDIYGPVDQYFRGIAAGLAAIGGAAEYRVGVYGSGAVCDYLKRARLADYAWLSNSTAWTGYGSFGEWNIRQGKAVPSLSFGHDWNDAREDYGGFKIKTLYSSL